MTVLVTGGAGFIGANFVLEWLSVEDRPIVNLDKLTYAGNMQSLAAVLDDQRHTFVQADIADSETVSELLDAHRPRAIIHCAAESHVDRSISGPDDFMQTNVLGTFCLLDASRQYFDSLSGAAIRLLLEQGKPGKTYNIGGDSEMTNLDVVDEICSLLDELVENPQVISHKQLISYIEDRPGHDRRYAVNADKIKTALTWKVSETFQSGLRKTVQWYLNNEDWIAEVESGEYRTWVDSHYGQGAVGQ